MTQATFVQIPIDLIQYARSLKLSGTQYDLWLYLWAKDPFGDRFVEIPSPETIAAELGVNPRTIQRAARRLQDADLFDFQIEGWKCRNTTISTPIKAPDKKIRIRTKRSNPGQKDPISDKKIQSRTKRSNLGQKDPNVEPETLKNNASGFPQTIHIHQTNQTSQTLQTARPPTPDPEVGTEGVENFFSEEDPCLDEDLWNDQREVELERTEDDQADQPEDGEEAKVNEGQGETEEKGLEEEGTQETEVNPQDRTPRDETPQKPRNSATKPKKNQIPQDLLDKLAELEVPLDAQVRRAIASHHISQAYGALRHIQETRGTVKNPRSVFLYQLPKQPVEQAARGTSTEFLEWYEQAIADGIVENIPPNYLCLDSHNEPLVRFIRPDPITNAPYILEKWRDVRDGKVTEYATPEQAKEFFEGNRSFIEKLKADIPPCRRWW